MNNNKITENHEKSDCHGAITDMISYNQSKYKQLREIIQQEWNLHDDEITDCVDLQNIIEQPKEALKTIGMIQKIHKTKNGNTIATIDDMTGQYTTMISKHDVSEQFCNKLINDEVIYLENNIATKPIRGSKDIKDRIYSYNIHEPSLTNHSTSFNKDLAIIFMSDIHVGSRNFREDKLLNTIKWINRHEVNAVMIAGDIVDGVGIYPNQYEDLEILDIYEQYKMLSEYLSLIEEAPVYITPGNHDAVRLAEPQPPIPEKYAKPLYKDENITMLSNPSTVNVNGINVRMYHGKSFDDMIQEIHTLDYTKPCEVMKEQLEKRHLSPTHGETTPKAWDNKDTLVINEIPDILHTGHVHVTQTMTYKGIHLVNSGCYQEQTSYQQSHKLQPTVGLIPILYNGRIIQKQF